MRLRYEILFGVVAGLALGFGATYLGFLIPELWWHVEHQQFELSQIGRDFSRAARETFNVPYFSLLNAALLALGWTLWRVFKKFEHKFSSSSQIG